ncbi:class I adenylate-forming enzyme family protein [Streptomyces sp. NPDC012751]|uniref:class I adenylate-forming enzyme family protein n=1 Tax=Streptomyces sp. NPDC012751 TaxID=3364846 RepID=UPI003689FF53
MVVSDGWWTGHRGYAAGIMSALRADPDRVAVHWRGEAVPAGALVRAVTAAAHTLEGLGVGPGSVVGVLVAPNSPDMLVARYAAHLLGGAVCYLRSTNPGTTAHVLAADAQLRILLDTSAAVLFTDEEHAGRALLLADRARGRIAVTGTGPHRAGVVPVAAGAHDVVAAAWEPRALALIAFTSGSTGRPKGISLSARAWDSVVSATGASITEGARARLLVVTPLSHTVGPMADSVLAAGGTVHLHEEPDAEAVLRTVAEHRITRTFLATTHLYRLLDHSGTAGADLSSLHQLIYSGSAASPARIAEANKVFGPVLVQGYGTSEGGRITLLDPGDHQDPDLLGTVGRPFPEVEVGIRDPDTRRELPVGTAGEVWVRSPHVMTGYWSDPALSARVLDDGWYRTGDIGRLDERGYLRLLDRVADVVKTGGVKVYPADVERELLAVPGVAQAAVYGVRDLDDVEHLHAAIVPRPGADVAVEDVRARVGAALSPQHVPEEVLLLDELPLNATGKPDKPRLRSRASVPTPYTESEMTR